MINRLDLNRENLVPRSRGKKIEEIEIDDFKYSMKDMAMANIIEFTCNLENKVKLLKHRWSRNVGEIRELEL